MSDCKNCGTCKKKKNYYYSDDRIHMVCSVDGSFVTEDDCCDAHEVKEYGNKTVSNMQ